MLKTSFYVVGFLLVGTFGTTAAGLILIGFVEHDVGNLDRMYTYIGAGLLLVSFLFLYFNIRHMFRAQLKAPGIDLAIEELVRGQTGDQTAVERERLTGVIFYRLRSTIPFGVTLIYALAVFGFALALNFSTFNVFVGLLMVGVVLLVALWWLYDSKRFELHLLKLMIERMSPPAQ